MSNLFYQDLPTCLRCKFCAMDRVIPVPLVKSGYTWAFRIECEHEKNFQFKDWLGRCQREFWYDPNTQLIWVDQGCEVKECKLFKAKFKVDELPKQ